MLTARDGEDDGSSAADSIAQRKIGRGIAGVERDDHVHIRFRGESMDIADLKMQMVISIAASRFIAMFNDVLFQVQSQHVYLKAANLRKIIIQDKGQIRLAAAEVDDLIMRIRPVPQNIVNHLDKTVDLTVFVGHGRDEAALTGKDAHVDQRGDDLPFGQKPLLGCGSESS